jgi:hypothetical protein
MDLQGPGGDFDDGSRVLEQDQYGCLYETTNWKSG